MKAMTILPFAVLLSMSGIADALTIYRRDEPRATPKSAPSGAYPPTYNHETLIISLKDSEGTPTWWTLDYGALALKEVKVEGFDDDEAQPSGVNGQTDCTTEQCDYQATSVYGRDDCKIYGWEIANGLSFTLQCGDDGAIDCPKPPEDAIYTLDHIKQQYLNFKPGQSAASADFVGRCQWS